MFNIRPLLVSPTLHGVVGLRPKSKISVSKKNQFKGVGLHKFSLSFAVLPQHLQINLGFDVNFLTFSTSNLCAGCAN